MISVQKKREEYEDFALELKRARNRLLMYQEPFAKLINISLSSLRGWEQGYNLPSQENFKKIMNVMYNRGIYTRELENSYVKARSSR